MFGVTKIILFNLFCLSYSLTNVSESIQSVGFKIENCDEVKSVDEELGEKVTALSQEGKKVIFIYLEFADHPNFSQGDYLGDIYKPEQWVRTYGRHGRSLLFLRPQFEHLSLTTLSFEIAHLKLKLIQRPEGCLSRQNLTNIERYIRQLLVMGYTMNLDKDRTDEKENVCNVRIINENSYMSLRYTCCWLKAGKKDIQLECQEIPKDKWISFVFMCVLLMKLSLLLFCPLLLPESFYRKKYTESVFEHVPTTPLELTIKKIPKAPNSKDDYSHIPCINMQQLKQLQDPCEWNKVSKMKKFYQTVKDLPPNVAFKISLRKLELVARHKKLIPPNYVPVGIFQVFYSLFIKCDIRKNNYFQDCCKTSVIGMGRLGKKRKNLRTSSKTKNGTTLIRSNDTKRASVYFHYPWHKCLRQTMLFLMLAGAFAPWIFRLYFYYEHEESEATYRKKIAQKHNLILPIFEWSLVYALSPTHPVFLLSYFVLLLDVVVVAFVPPNTKKRLQSLLRRSLRDMKQVSKLDKVKGAIVLLLLPCEFCGTFGLLLYPFYLVVVAPIILISLVFYCLPTLNLTIRLLSYFLGYSTETPVACRGGGKIFFKKKLSLLFDFIHVEAHERETFKSSEKFKTKIFQLLILPISLLTVFSLVLLSMETIIFYVEMVLYTIIGIIMNSEDMLKYLTTMFMLGLYANDCFKGITEKYMHFNQTMNSLIVDMNRNKIEQVADSTFEDQRNTAFTIRGDENEANEKPGDIKLVCKDGIPKWSVRRLILFLDRQDQPFLTKKFFFSTCFMDTVGTPGPLIPNILKALWRFICIFAFLMFVVLIVLAFGEEYGISGTNQMLATLAGGLIPFVFTSFVLKERDPPEVDVENLSFKSNLKFNIDNNVQTWDVYDIDVSESLIIQTRTSASRNTCLYEGEEETVDLLIEDTCTRKFSI